MFLSIYLLDLATQEGCKAELTYVVRVCQWQRRLLLLFLLLCYEFVEWRVFRCRPSRLTMSLSVYMNGRLTPTPSTWRWRSRQDAVRWVIPRLSTFAICFSAFTPGPAWLPKKSVQIVGLIRTSQWHQSTEVWWHFVNLILRWNRYTI